MITEKEVNLTSILMYVGLACMVYWLYSIYQDGANIWNVSNMMIATLGFAGNRYNLKEYYGFNGED